MQSTIRNNKMESSKVAYLILEFFGWSTYVLGITTNWNTIDNYKSFFLFLLGATFLAVKILDKIEDWRKKKIENDERSWELKEKHKYDKVKP